jgi:hypothetical protein
MEGGSEANKCRRVLHTELKNAQRTQQFPERPIGAWSETNKCRRVLKTEIKNALRRLLLPEMPMEDSQRQINAAEFYRQGARMRSACNSFQRGILEDGQRQINAAGLFVGCFSNKSKKQSIDRTARVNR